MLSEVEVRNFQSLHHIKVELGRFTAVVGASSSGKSAFTRSLKTLTGNQRGHAFITHGERISTIKAVTDRGTVTLKRGKTTDDNEYVTTPSEHPEEQKTYTKLSGTVPEEVSEFIGIAAKDPINYAGQFDRPYLLDDSGSEVARVLGSLTNVNVLFEGARESNRQKLQSASLLKTRANDLAAIKEKIQDYRPLKNQLDAITEAEKNLAEVVETKRRIEKLARHRDLLTTAESALTVLEEILAIPTPDIHAITALGIRIDRLRHHRDELANYSMNLDLAEEILAVPTPHAQTIADASQRLTNFQHLTASVRSMQGVYRAAQTELAAAESEETQLNEQYTQLLIDAGTCPVCNQSTNELEHSHS